MVLDVWRNRHDAVRKLAGKLDSRVRELERRKAKLEEAFLYEETIDRATYKKHSDQLSEERVLTLMEKHAHELEGMDVEALLNYAEFVAANPARLLAGRQSRATAPAPGVLGSNWSDLGW